MPRLHSTEGPENLAGVKFFQLESWEVANFHEENDAKGDPSQVHLVFKLAGSKELEAAGGQEIPWFIVRLKSGQAVDELVSALTVHRQEVFGSYAEDGKTE